MLSLSEKSYFSIWTYIKEKLRLTFETNAGFVFNNLAELSNLLESIIIKLI